MTSKRWNVCVLVAVMAGFAAGALAQTMDWPFFSGATLGEVHDEVDSMGNTWWFGTTAGTLSNPPNLATLKHANATWATTPHAAPPITRPGTPSNDYWNASAHAGNLEHINGHPFTWTWGFEHGYLITIGKAGLYDIRGSLTHSAAIGMRVGAFKIRNGVTNYQQLASFTAAAGTPTDLESGASAVDPVYLEVGDTLFIGSGAGQHSIDWASTDLVRTDPVATTMDWPWFDGITPGEIHDEVDSVGNTWWFGTTAGTLSNPPDLATLKHANATWATTPHAAPPITRPGTPSNDYWNASAHAGNLEHINGHPFTWTWGYEHGYLITAGQPGTYEIKGSLTHSTAIGMQVGAFTFVGGATNWQQLASFTTSAGTPTDLESGASDVDPVDLNPGDILFIGSGGGVHSIDWASTDLVFTPVPELGTVIGIR